MCGIVRPVQQGDGEELKTEISKTSLPIPRELAVKLSAGVAGWGRGLRRHRPRRPADLDVSHRASDPFGAAESRRATEDFRFHDLRHYLESLLIGSGLDVKVVQHRLRHGSAKTMLDTYGHLWPDSDEAARAAVAAVLAARGDSLGTANASLR